MKKIFTYLSSAALIILLFTSCAKEKVYDARGHWLTQESGDVVYSNNVCGYYVVETNYGYTIIENLDGYQSLKVILYMATLAVMVAGIFITLMLI